MHACTWFAAEKPFIKRTYVVLCYIGLVSVWTARKIALETNADT